MTLMDTPVEEQQAAAASPALDQPPPDLEPTPATPEDAPLDVPLRPLIAVALSMAGAAAMAGGIFGSWTARGFALAGVLLGVGWTYLALRRRRIRMAIQMLLVPVAIVVEVALLTVMTALL